MKKINNFLDKSPLWKVWLVIYPIITIFVGGFIFILDYFEPTNDIFTRNLNYLKFGATMSILFTSLVTLLISMIRKSQIFWNSAKELEALIDGVKSKEDLEEIYKNQFQELRLKSQGGPHIGELNRLKSIIETRYKYW